MNQVKLKGSGQTYQVGKIICLGRNYLDHIRELGNKVPDRAVLFCKPASSLLKDGGMIALALLALVPILYRRVRDRRASPPPA